MSLAETAGSERGPYRPVHLSEREIEALMYVSEEALDSWLQKPEFRTDLGFALDRLTAAFAQILTAQLRQLPTFEIE